MNKLIVALMAYSLVTVGCVTVKLENSQRLMARPDFEAAVHASPEWVREALHTINRLEQVIEAD